jgi:hypothetical protein
MEAASTFKILVNFYPTTQHNIPEDRHLHILKLSVCLDSYTYRGQHSTEEHGQTSMHQVGLEPMIPVFDLLRPIL